MTVLRGLKDLIIEAVDKGATSTEEVLKSIANLPFETLVIIGDTAKSLKELQEESIGKVYEMIHTMNQEISESADRWLEKLEKEKEKGEATKRSKPKVATKPKPKSAIKSKPKGAAKPKPKSVK